VAALSRTEGTLSNWSKGFSGVGGTG